MVSSKPYGVTPEGNVIHEFLITGANGISMQIINYGCTITSILVPDSHGQFNDVVLGFDSLEGYLASKDYFGCIIGQCANRIANGSLKLNDHLYQLSINHFPHHLHGGFTGFDKIIWEAEKMEGEKGEGWKFFHVHADGIEGYPGNVHVEASYSINQEGNIVMHYEASTDKETIINLTQHSYYNLQGKGSISDQFLWLNADRFLPVDPDKIPSGETRSVKGTPFDFTQAKPLGLALSDEEAQLKIANGLDHNFMLNKTANELSHAATLSEPHGRSMEFYTTEPGVQIYTANFVNHVMGKNKMLYGPHSGVCIETQHYPDTPHHPSFPSVVLKPGSLYESTTMLKFSFR